MEKEKGDDKVKKVIPGAALILIGLYATFPASQLVLGIGLGVYIIGLIEYLKEIDNEEEDTTNDADPDDDSSVNSPHNVRNYYNINLRDGSVVHKRYIVK